MDEVQIANQLRGSLYEAVLLSVNEAGGQMTLEAVIEVAGSYEEALESAVALRNLGLARPDESLAAEVTLTPLGRRVADRIKRSMVSGARRADAVQRAILGWLNEQQDRPVEVLTFLETGDAVVWGVPITKREVEEAAQLLEARGLIEAISTDHSSGLMPAITPDGRTALQSEVLISEFGRSNATTISYDYSNNLTFGNQNQIGAVQTGGQRNVQIVTQTIAPEVRGDLAERLATLQTLARELPDDTPGIEEVREALAEMDTELAQPEPKRSRFKELASNALATAVTTGAAATGTAGGQQLVEGLGYLVKLFT